MEKHHGQGMMLTQTRVRDTTNRKHSSRNEMTLGFPRDQNSLAGNHRHLPNFFSPAGL